MILNIYIIKILNRLGILKYFNISSSFSLNGSSFRIPIIGPIGYSNLHISEKWMIELLEGIYKTQGGTFVDVGVNIGQTLVKLKSAAPSINYIGFEPNPICINYVEQLISQNSFENTTLIPVGISESEDLLELNFFHASETDSSASLIAEFRPDEKVTSKKFVPVFSVDYLDKKIDFSNVSVVKIDVEGAELEVINSFSLVLEKYRPIVLMEILPVYKESNSYRIDRQNKILDILKGNRYDFYRILRDGNQLKQLKKINQIEVHSDLELCDYIFVPSSKTEEVLEPFHLI